MRDVDRARIREIKAKVAAMLDERGALEGGQAPGAGPSRYWSDFCAFFDYLPGLPEESYEKLRLHTYHLTGDNYQRYYFGDARAFLATGEWEALTAGLPNGFVLNEPEGGIGFRYPDGRFLSLDVLRFQRIVTNLYRHGILSRLTGVQGRRPRVLEIGGGYGGLAHHLQRVCGGRLSYFGVDLPETLLFSASYLALQNPGKKLYLYDHGDFEGRVRSGALDAYDFVLLPNYALEGLGKTSFDLVLNLASFQEMTADQVAWYLDFIQAHCQGMLYSWNKDHEPRNRELGSLSQALRERFEVTELAPPLLPGNGSRGWRESLRLNVKKALKNTAALAGLLEKKGAAPDEPFCEYLCRPLPLRGP